MTDSTQKLKLERVRGALIILFYVGLSSPPLQSGFKENAKILPKISTTQKNITISRQNSLFLKKTHTHTQTTTLQRVTGGKIPNLVLERMLEFFLKILLHKKILEFQD